MIKTEIKNLFLYPKMLLNSLVTLFTTPKLLMYTIIPYIIAIFIFTSTFYLGFDNLEKIIGFFTNANSGFLYYLFWFISFTIVCIFTSAISLLGTIILGGFFIDLMLEKILIEKNIIHKDGITLKEMLRQNIKSIGADILIAIILTLCFIVAFFLSFFPLLSFLPLLIASFTLGLGLIDRIMSISLLTSKERLSFIKSHKVKTLSLGIFFTIVFCIPFGSIIFMPPALIMTANVLSNDLTKQEISQ